MLDTFSVDFLRFFAGPVRIFRRPILPGILIDAESAAALWLRSIAMLAEPALRHEKG